MRSYKRLCIVFFSLCFMSPTMAQSKKQQIKELEIELRDLREELSTQEGQLEILRERQIKKIEDKQRQIAAKHEIIKRQEISIRKETQQLLNEEEENHKKTTSNLDKAYNEIYTHFNSRIQLLNENDLMPKTQIFYKN